MKLRRILSREALDELLERAITAIMGPTQVWPVLKGNRVVGIWMLHRNAMNAQVGDRVKVRTGGFVQKVRDSGWVQWAWFHDNDPAAPEHTGKWVGLLPAKIAELSDAERTGKSA